MVTMVREEAFPGNGLFPLARRTRSGLAFVVQTEERGAVLA